MKIINEKLMKRFELFFKNIKPSDKIALFHDTDPDGTSSGKIIYEAVKRLGAEISLILVSNSHIIPDKIIIELQEKGINKLITTDKSVDEGPEQIKKIEKFSEICVFDHHVIQKDISSKKTLFLKPQILFDTDKPSQYCSAKFTYDLLNRVVDLSDLDWICVTGIIGDMAAVTWKDFVDGVFKRYNLEIKEDIFESELGLLTQLISFAEAMGESEECFDIILESKNIKESIEKLSKYKEVKEEADYYYNNFDKLSKKQGNLIILEIESKYNIKTIVASKTSNKRYPHTTIIVTQKFGEIMAISARRSDSKIAMNILLKRSLEGLRGKGGGHVPASGASVHLEDYEQFKKNLVKVLKEMEG